MNWVIIGSCNGLLPDGTKPLPEPMPTNCQLDPYRANFSEIQIKISKFSFITMYTKMSSVKWQMSINNIATSFLCDNDFIICLLAHWIEVNLTMPLEYLVSILFEIDNKGHHHLEILSYILKLSDRSSLIQVMVWNQLGTKSLPHL